MYPYINLKLDLIFAFVFLGIYLICFCIEKYCCSTDNDAKSLKNALISSIIWIIAALVFNIILWLYLKINFNLNVANQKSLEFLAGYILERSLSIDNLFIFILIFSYFNIKDSDQKRALKYGIMLAIFFRILMIFFGIWLLAKVHWILYIFGALLIISGVKMIINKHEHNKNNTALKNNIIINWCKKHLRTTTRLHKNYFFIKKNGKLYATPLFLAMIMITMSDAVFAIDSIPAILAILNDPFIILSSNIFAILGLRSLYYILSISINKFSFLEKTIAALLIFVGAKMLFDLSISIQLSLTIMLTIIIGSIIINIINLKKISKYFTFN